MEMKKKVCPMKCLKVLVINLYWMLLIENMHINMCLITSHVCIHGLGIQPIPYNHILLNVPHY
jgi:hypothetical protein